MTRLNARNERQPMADFLGLMKQAAELKTKMESMQAEMDRFVTGLQEEVVRHRSQGAGGGSQALVRVGAQGRIIKIKKG